MQIPARHPDLRCRRPERARHGFSTAETMVVIAITAILVGISVTALSKVRRSRSQSVCAANLHALGIAFASYAADFQDNFPNPSPTAQWEDLLRDYVHRSTFRCPADQELFASLGSSYDWRDTGNSLTTLAGKSHMQVGRNDVSLAFDTLPGWHIPRQFQVLQVDGSTVLMLMEDDFFKEMQRSPDAP